MIVTVTPNPSLDRTLLIDKLERGGVHRATAEFEEPSGKGVNVSRALHANGVPTEALLPLGGDVGAMLAAMLTAEGVRFRAVDIAGPTRINTSLTEPDGFATKVNSLGPALTAAEANALITALTAALSSGDHLVAAGSLPRGVPAEYYVTIVEAARRRAATVILDCSGEPFRVGLAGRPDVVKPNLEELEEAVGSRLTTLGTAAEAAAELIGRGARAVLLSLGAHGALLVTPDGRWHATGKPERVFSTIGAGDALLAGFVAGGARGPDALGEAVAWATAAVGTVGSHVPVITDAHRRTVTVAEHVNATRQLALNRTLRRGSARTAPS